ncbi:hypothetical protein KIPB_017204, partial [Kipferlia bialata]|eukprot:g17204.t1
MSVLIPSAYGVSNVVAISHRTSPETEYVYHSTIE